MTEEILQHLRDWERHQCRQPLDDTIGQCRRLRKGEPPAKRDPDVVEVRNDHIHRAGPRRGEHVVRALRCQRSVNEHRDVGILGTHRAHRALDRAAAAVTPLGDDRGRRTICHGARQLLRVVAERELRVRAHGAAQTSSSSRITDERGNGNHELMRSVVPG